MEDVDYGTADDANFGDGVQVHRQRESVHVLVFLDKLDLLDE